MDNRDYQRWIAPPLMEPIIFSLRSANYFTNKQKSPGGDYLLSPASVDWLKSSEKLRQPPYSSRQPR
ncbi:hypothetical protein HID58_084563 [Brassica napus]|uniref:Protein ENHANCED DISEASE RESISTANCE 2 C-terminal domain-containing protein n=1 Tax=Brassica napus TaxID=3708 RepID=A0ABQ7XM17_BRANA|nr:hypothetical protein HID58_084563 [Brassica napus]